MRLVAPLPSRHALLEAMDWITAAATVGIILTLVVSR